MGFDSKSLPDSFRRKMEVDDRKSLGKAGMTFDEADRKRQVTAEKELHTTFGQWLEIRGIPAAHSRMDKPSTIQKGWPDFTVCNQGKVLFVEFKADGGTLSEDQEKVIRFLREVGNKVLVTTDAGEAIRLCVAYFNL